MCVYLRDKFEVSSIILTSVRQRVGVGMGGGGGGQLYPSTSKRTHKKPTQIRVKRSPIFREILYASKSDKRRFELIKIKSFVFLRK